MNNKPKMTWFFFVAIATVSFVCLATTGFFYIRGDIARHRQESGVVADNLMAFHKQILTDQVNSVVEYIEYQRSQTEIRLKTDIRNRVINAHKVAMNIYRKNKGRFDDAFIRKMIVNALRPIRFNNDRGYYFITAFTGVVILFADHPELEGTNLIAIQDANGQFVNKDMIKIARQKKEGFYRYTWTKPGVKAHDNPKIAYVKHFEPYDWFIGTGEYTANVDQEIRSQVLARIEKIRFGNDGYVFAGTIEGVSLSGPAKGKNMINVTDVNGVKIVRELISAAHNGGGFVQYVLPPFEGYLSRRKLSYTREVTDWRWYVGSGVDITAIEEAIFAKKAQLAKDIRQRIIMILSLAAGLLGIMFVAARYLALKISRDYDVFYTFFKKAALKRKKIDLSTTQFYEFHQLAKAANEMIKELRQAGKKLRKNEANMRAILHSIGDAVIAADTDGNIVHMNPVAERLTGWILEDARNKPLTEIFNIVDARTNTPAPDPIKRVLANGQIEGCTHHTTLIAKHGDKYRIADSGAPIRDADGNITGVVLVFRDVTEEYALKEKIAASEQKHRQFVENFQGIAYQADIKSCQPHLCKGIIEQITGYDPRSFLNGAVNWKDLIHPEDIAGVDAMVEKLLAYPDYVADSEYRIRRKDGNVCWVRDVGRLTLIDGRSLVQGTVIDITDRKKAEEELRRLRNYLANIIDSMPSVLVGVDPDGIITQWNNEAQRVTGVLPIDAVGHPLDKALPCFDSAMEQVREAMQTREVQTVPKQARQENGEIYYENVTVYPLIANGIEGAVIRIDDVTEQVRLEEMMIQSEKMLSVGGLAAGMAHEINNPLAGMMQTAENMSNRLTDINLPANQRAARATGMNMEAICAFMESRGILRMIATINESGRRVAEVVDNMLSFARKCDTGVSSHDIAVLMDKTLQLAATDYDLKKQYDFKRINIKKEYAANLPLVPCEGAKIQQVLLNILRNGAHAMYNNRYGMVNAKGEKACFILRLACEKADGMVRIEIEDNGSGMDEVVCKRVFEPFFTTKPVGEGTGLGLSVSYFIITENHGGTMNVISQPGMGATFIIRLPQEIKGGKL